MPLVGYSKSEWNKNYRKLHSTDIKTYLKFYRESHKEELRAKNLLYKQVHRTEIRLKNRRTMCLNRAKKKNAIVVCQCKICDRLFFVPRTMRTGNHYCSESCRKAGTRNLQRLWERTHGCECADERRLKICRNCGNIFMRPIRKSNKYCSEKCKLEGYKKRTLESAHRRMKWLAMAGVHPFWVANSDYAIKNEIKILNRIKETRLIKQE